MSAGGGPVDANIMFEWLEVEEEEREDALKFFTELVMMSRLWTRSASKSG
jgi:hypothetical protein